MSRCYSKENEDKSAKQDEYVVKAESACCEKQQEFQKNVSNDTVL